MDRKSKKSIHSEARNIINNVIKFFERQKAAGEWSFPLEKATELAAAAVGKSVSTILRIRKEAQVAEDRLLKSPSKKKRSGGSNKLVLDDCDLGILKRTVHEVYTVDKQVPTIKLLLDKMRNKVNYSGGEDTLRKHLLNIGFKFKKCHNKRKLLMERYDIVAWRSRYLRKLRENNALAENKKPVTFLDETYIHPSYGVGKCWQSEDQPGVYRTDRSGQRYIIVHAGGAYGFVNNGLLIFKSKSKSGDYHDDMNHHNFMQWVEKQLIPNLPPNGIVVMDNAPYHSVQINKPPTQATRKQDIRDWLESNGVSTTSEMRKAELITLVKARNWTKTYYVDELLKKHGHTVLRLPPYHCDLNPIELIWSLAKHKVAMNNVSQSGLQIENLVRTAFADIQPSDWAKHCTHVDHIAEEMWQRDGLMDETVEKLVITINTGQSEEETSSDEDWNSD